MVGFREISSIAIIIATAGILLGIGSQITNKIGEQSDLTKASESVTFTNNTYQYLGQWPMVSVTNIYNGSGATTTDFPQQLSNSSMNASLGWSLGSGGNASERGNRLKIMTCQPIATLTWTVNYSHYNTPGYRIAANTSSGLSEVAQWMPTIGLVIAAAIIIGILVRSFTGTRTSI